MAASAKPHIAIERHDPAGGARGTPRHEPGRAFDDQRPPSLDLIEDCVHCGFCLPTCPT